HALQLARESLENLTRKNVGKLLGQRRPELGLDASNDGIEAQSLETLARLLIGQAKAGFAEPAAGHGERDHLAVDQHPVAIENDDFGPARPARRPANLALGLPQDFISLTLSRVESRDRPARRRCSKRDRRHR